MEKGKRKKENTNNIHDPNKPLSSLSSRIKMVCVETTQ